MSETVTDRATEGGRSTVSSGRAAPVGLASALARLSAARDPAAWAVLVEQAGPHLWRVAARLCQDAHAADDAMQEALLLVRDHAHQFKDPGRGSDRAALAWMTTIAAHVVMGVHRRRRIRREVPLAQAASLSRPGSGAMHGQWDSDEVEKVQAALWSLPHSLRLPLALYYLAELPIDEVAAALRITAGNAKVRIHRGLGQLRQRLAGRRSELSLGALLPALLSPLKNPFPDYYNLLTLQRAARVRMPLANPLPGVLMSSSATLLVFVIAAAIQVARLHGVESQAAANPAPHPLPASEAASPPSADPGHLTEATRTVPTDAVYDDNQPISLIARGEPLSLVLASLSKMTRVSIRVADAAIGARPVSCHFTATPLLSACRTLAAEAGAEVQLAAPTGALLIETRPQAPDAAGPTIEVRPSPAGSPWLSIPGSVDGVFLGGGQRFGTSGHVMMHEYQGRLVYALIAPYRVLKGGSYSSQSGPGPATSDGKSSYQFSDQMAQIQIVATFDGAGWHATIGDTAVDLHRGNIFLVSGAWDRLVVDQVDVDLGSAAPAALPRPSSSDPSITEILKALTQQTPVFALLAAWAERDPRAHNIIHAPPAAQ